MFLNFEPVSLYKQHDYLRLLMKTPWKASDYSFINLLGWGREYGLEWAWENNMVWIRQTVPETIYWAPIGDWENTDWNQVLESFCPENNHFTRIPGALMQIWKKIFQDRIQVKPVKAHWDYIYLANELIELKGNRFHKKKNLLKQFKRKYNYSYKPLNSGLIQSVLEMQEDWCLCRDCESAETLAAENRAVSRVLNEWQKLENLLGGAVFVDNIMAAFTIAEEMPDDMVLIHFEKGMTDYKGIYQAVNQMFLEAENRFKYVNREQDLGEEGLRKAKRSYNPVDFIEKYQAEFL
ncbi:DUF2156 [Desulfonema limicola]|uniref:DUF2156 n=1 Tax=Desulfonema limicola TaxID=45656 RepID=A0A975B632_9BACT|nr:phosphatidylglycerol lysyltransferase domain-containing protein [Desulfonema limicola]QTA79508.1 DUF2156 [Desulfonema limicola]